MKPLFLVFSIALVSFPATADTETSPYSWTGYTKVVEMEPAIGGWTWVYPASGKIECGAGKKTNLQLTTSGVDGAVSSARDRIYTTLLGAMFAGKEESFRVRRHTDPANAWCVIERIAVKP